MKLSRKMQDDLRRNQDKAAARAQSGVEKKDSGRSRRSNDGWRVG